MLLKQTVAAKLRIEINRRIYSIRSLIFFIFFIIWASPLLSQGSGFPGKNGQDTLRLKSCLVYLSGVKNFTPDIRSRLRPNASVCLPNGTVPIPDAYASGPCAQAHTSNKRVLMFFCKAKNASLTSKSELAACYQHAAIPDAENYFKRGNKKSPITFVVNFSLAGPFSCS